MSADYWTSSQRRIWQFSKDELANKRSQLVTIPGLELPHFRIFLHSLISQLGRRLSLRQKIIATAETYCLRFYISVSINEINVYLLVTSALYIACKVEESPLHVRTLVSEAKSLWPEQISYDATKIAECEFYLIEEMDCYLIVHHPYKTLIQLKEMEGGGFLKDEEEMQSCWSIINDSYVSDLPLIVPPHIIAFSAVYITLVLSSPSGGSSAITGVGGANSTGPGSSGANGQTGKLGPPPGAGGTGGTGAVGGRRSSVVGGTPYEDRSSRFMKFLATSNVDLELMIDTIQEMISIYEVWDSYDEVRCKKLLAKSFQR